MNKAYIKQLEKRYSDTCEEYLKAFCENYDRRYELDSWVAALAVLSVGVEACVWNRACIVFLSLVLLQKYFFLEHTIDETYFAVVLVLNSTIGILLVVKGIKIISRKQ